MIDAAPGRKRVLRRPPACFQVIGEETTPVPTWNFQTSSPVLASKVFRRLPEAGSIAFNEPIWSSKTGLMEKPAPS